MLEEADDQLTPGYLQLEVFGGKHLRAYPQRAALISKLRQKGFAAARCHLEPKAIRTNASVRQLVAASLEVRVWAS